ncbi:MAG: class I SAM-dependent methyltransferase [Thermoleophilaceae bacterium]
MAGDYDALYGAIPDTEEAVALLAELAGDGPLLELGIGTGRLALPLAARGVEVHGVEASEAMIAELARKPGGEDIPVVQILVRRLPDRRALHVRGARPAHDLRPALPRPPGALLRDRGRAPASRRRLRRRGQPGRPGGLPQREGRSCPDSGRRSGSSSR